MNCATDSVSKQYFVYIQVKVKVMEQLSTFEDMITNFRCLLHVTYLYYFSGGRLLFSFYPQSGWVELLHTSLKQTITNTRKWNKWKKKSIYSLPSKLLNRSPVSYCFTPQWAIDSLAGPVVIYLGQIISWTNFVNWQQNWGHLYPPGQWHLSSSNSSH